MHDDYSDLDIAFELTAVIEDPKLRELYEHIISRMRSEAEGVPMPVTANLMMERIATNYVLVKSQERIPYGQPGGFNNLTAHKSATNQLITWMTEFNKMLVKKTPEAIRLEAYRDATEKVLRVISQIANIELRERLTDRLLAEFEKSGN